MLNRTLTQVYGEENSFRLWDWLRTHISNFPPSLEELTLPILDPHLRVQVRDLVCSTILCLSPIPNPHEGRAPPPSFPQQRHGDQLVHRMEAITEKILFFVVGKNSGEQLAGGVGSGLDQMDLNPPFINFFHSFVVL